MDKKFIYVCLSECKQIVKVGISYNVSTRVVGLKTSEGQSFRVLFCSKEVLLDRAIEVEKAVNLKFKSDIVKGNEWYSTKPINIIEFLLNELGIEIFEMGEVTTQFESWEHSVSEHKSFKEGLEYPHIKEKASKGLYSIMYVDKGEFKYVGFCNYGDAKKFYYTNKIFILMADNIIEDLYGINVSDFYVLKIPTKKNLYGLKEQIKEVREKLMNLLKITEF